MAPIVRIDDEPQGDVKQRAVWWAMFVSQLLITEFSLRDEIPTNSHLVVLPTDDAELCDHNTSLAKRMEAEEDNLIVYIEVERHGDTVSVVPKLSPKAHTYTVA